MSTTAYPSIPALQKIRFWLAFLAGLIGFGYIIGLGGFAFGGNYTFQLIGFVLALIIGLCWSIWRWAIWRDHLPNTGLEWAIALGLWVIFISLAVSSDPRQGFWRVGWLLACALMFYVFLDLLATDIDRWGLFAGLAAAVGLVLLQAVAETTQWYFAWFQNSGSFNLPTEQYRYTGILLSNPTLGLANLMVFGMLVAFRKPQPKLVKFGAAIWLFLYIIALPFASSRSGWLGLGVGGLTGLCLWGWNQRAWRILRRWPHLRQAGLLLLLIAGGFIITRLAVLFITFFATSATHGGDPFGDSGRSIFWANALRIWRSAPWFGVGPGRFGFEYLGMQTGIPPGFWPIQAHNIFLQALAEFGLAGLAAWLFLLAAIGRWCQNQLRGAGPADWPWIAAISAGLSALLSQQLFDDMTAWMAVIIPAVFLIAWIGTSAPGKLPTFKRISLGWLVIPTFVLIALAGWQLWAYRPLTQSHDLAMIGNWRRAAELASESARRDPNFHFYQTQAGILWSWEWAFNHDPDSLTQSRVHLARSLEIEEQPSWIWADLAVLDFYAGQPDAALNHITRAIALSSNFPAYYLNRAAILETGGSADPALSDYRKALSLQPDLVNHPFWRTTPLRAEALRLSGLDPILTPAAGPAHDDGLIQALDQSRFNLDPGVIFFYDAFLSNRRGVGMLVVPGFIQLTPDLGQFDALDREIKASLSQHDCPSAQKLAELKQQAISGFALGGSTPILACP